MSISIERKSLVLGVMLAALLPIGTAHAQMKTEDPDVMDVARTPLEDFNIKSEDIPEVLLAAVLNPYEDTGISSCNDVVSRIAILDNVLGPDFDIPQEERANISAGRVAKTVVGSFVPFRGIVREVTGANKKRNERRLAFTAGMVRRGYLKGMGEARGCSYPAKPREIGNELAPGVSSPVPPDIPRDGPEE